MLFWHEKWLYSIKVYILGSQSFDVFRSKCFLSFILFYFLNSILCFATFATKPRDCTFECIEGYHLNTTNMIPSYRSIEMCAELRFEKTWNTYKDVLNQYRLTFIASFYGTHYYYYYWTAIFRFGTYLYVYIYIHNICI